MIDGYSRKNCAINHWKYIVKYFGRTVVKLISLELRSKKFDTPTSKNLHFNKPKPKYLGIIYCGVKDIIHCDVKT